MFRFENLILVKLITNTKSSYKSFLWIFDHLLFEFFVSHRKQQKKVRKQGTSFIILISSRKNNLSYSYFL